MNKTLKSFIDYCLAHPQERFWQALRNWSGYNFILRTNTSKWFCEPLIEDTFYIEDEK
jgi:hypothetical protein